MIRLVRRQVQRLAICLVGLAILVGGLIVLPMPIPLGWIMIPMGLIVLAAEVPVARRVLDLIQERTGPFGRGVRAAEGTAVRWAASVTRKLKGQPAPGPNSKEPASGGDVQPVSPPTEHPRHKGW